MTEPGRPSSGRTAVQRPSDGRARWLRRRARNVARRPMSVAVYGVVIFVAALVALVIAPAAARRESGAPPPAPTRPDTSSLRRAAAAAAARAVAAEQQLASARDALARTTDEPAILDTLSAVTRARRDSIAEESGLLARLLRRTEEAPLVASWRALGESRPLRGIPRVRQIVDSLIEVDRSRSDFGAAGGIDPIFVALTARAAELGRELEEIAANRRAALRTELDRMQPVHRPRVLARPSIDTMPLVATADSARRELAFAQRALARGHAMHRALDQEAARAREEVARTGASPLAMLSAALVLGLALGYAVTLIGEMRRPRIADAHEAAAVAHAPVLTRIRPQVESPERGRRRTDRELSPLLDLTSGSYEVVRAELAKEGIEGRAVAVVADDAGVAATVATNLAAAWAQLARSALVVDMDFETHGVSAVLRTRRSPGVTDLLARRIEWPEALRTALVGRDRTVDVLPSGRNARGTLQGASGELAGELAHLVRRYEVVVVSAPHSKLGVVPAVSTAVREVVLCVRRGRTRLSALQQLVRAVTENGARLRGLVLWEAEDPVPTALSEADRAAGRDEPVFTQTTELPSRGSG